MLICSTCTSICGIFFCNYMDNVATNLAENNLKDLAASFGAELDKAYEENPDMTISWGQVTGTPTTLKGYGIKETYSLSGHTHRALDITDFPSSLPANGGDANTVKGKKPGNESGDLLVLNGAACINSSVLPNNEDGQVAHALPPRLSSPSVIGVAMTARVGCSTKSYQNRIYGDSGHQIPPLSNRCPTWNISHGQVC